MWALTLAPAQALAAAAASPAEPPARDRPPARAKNSPSLAKGSLGSKPVAQAAPAQGEQDADEGGSVGGELDLNSRYLWRGIALSTGPVLQPSAWLSWRGWTAAVGANIMLTEESSRPLTIVVPTVGYLWSRGPLALNAEATLMWDTSAMPDNPTAATLGLEASWRHAFVELGTHHYVNIVTQPGAYYGEVAAGLNGESGAWLLSFVAQLGLGSPAFRELYLDEQGPCLGVFDAGLRLQFSFADVFYASLHAETYTLLNQTLPADASRSLANIGLIFGAES